jgi:hypothetical protein
MQQNLKSQHAGDPTVMRLAHEHASGRRPSAGHPRGPLTTGDLMSNKNEDWVTTKRKYRLTDVQIQMARELGMNPRKFGSLANQKQEKWKTPLADFIEELYFKRFRKEKPDSIRKMP